MVRDYFKLLKNKRPTIEKSKSKQTKACFESGDIAGFDKFRESIRKTMKDIN